MSSVATPKKAEGFMLERFGPYHGQRVLEVGSAEDAWSRRARKICAGSDYIGLDMRPGKTVDIVHNLNDPIPLPPFDTIICQSVLEHCDKPWKVAENLTSLLKPIGRILITAPFAWRVHGYPNDYFRFTFEGIKVLFPEIEWDFMACWPGSAILERHPESQVMIHMAGRRMGVKA